MQLSNTMYNDDANSMEYPTSKTINQDRGKIKFNIVRLNVYNSVDVKFLICPFYYTGFRIAILLKPLKKRGSFCF